MSNDKTEIELEWVRVRSRLSDMKEEGLREKMIRKTKANPFVPVGVLLTTAALSYGLWCMRSGNRYRSQLMMRARVLAQGFTIGAILVGLAIGISKKDAEK
ncbi:HIG1 domain family member 2A-like [Centruroides sculpturatus]|uniref:HIG1 domain family member 2A-like n=1 Tax=Centruroides sculpturatus TaxID=218467 RepID=UPI000C6D9E9D|nr:HIG1 domain family member 2A-like [Centruroides sculpturatus]